MYRRLERPASHEMIVPQRNIAADMATLWITGSCPGLEQKLLRTSLPRAIVFRPGASREPDSFPDLQTLNLIAKVITDQNVGHVIVWGQPDDVPPRTEANLADVPDSTSSYDEMLHRIRDRLNRLQKALSLVRARFDRIRTHPEIAQAVYERSVRLSAIFHIAESDALLVYDLTTEEFVPMIIEDR